MNTDLFNSKLCTFSEPLCYTHLKVYIFVYIYIYYTDTYIHFYVSDISVSHHLPTYHICHISHTEASTVHAKSHIGKCDKSSEEGDHIGLWWSAVLQERDETKAEPCRMV